MKGIYSTYTGAHWLVRLSRGDEALAGDAQGHGRIYSAENRLDHDEAR